MIDSRSTSFDGHDQASTTSADDELRRSSKAFLADLEQLHDMEVRKAAMASDDPERPDLARRIEDLVAILLSRSAYQRRLADEGFQQRHDGGEPRHPAVVLADWRDAEHRLMEGRATLQRAVDDAERFREEYRIAFTEVRERERLDGI